MTERSTSEKIASAARRLLDREGADAITMRRVAEAVGITAMAVYRHYPNRAGLLNGLADEGFAELTLRLEGLRPSGDVKRRLERVMDVFLDHALERPRMFELMFLKPREGARRFPEDFRAGRSPTANPSAAILREGMEEGVLREDDVWEIVFEMGALLQGLIMLYLGGRMSMSEKEFRKFCRRSFERYMHGICR
ncbi:TetR/AcrR family transcriptional regulator [Edaphobacter aggregans]|uniref:TetR/AcrR family transcriptional regulator n=1 Tax=Edaphobacter aggregans TaxID=570835 RepID=UPI000552DA2C|nr:TetR/AcrR family transcriptional regulator [Edaphobacter aggregans]